MTFTGWRDFWACFHERWGSDKGSLTYNKERWSYLQGILERQERDDEAKREEFSLLIIKGGTVDVRRFTDLELAVEAYRREAIEIQRTLDWPPRICHGR